MHLARETRASCSRLDSNRVPRVPVGDAQYRLRSAPSKHEIRLIQQVADVGTRVMTGHRVVGVAK